MDTAIIDVEEFVWNSVTNIVDSITNMFTLKPEKRRL